MAKPPKKPEYTVNPNTGLPSKIDTDDLIRLARLHLTFKELADWFGVTTEYMQTEPFASIVQKAKSETKQRLKQKALQRALSDGSDTMLKFCLKNYCGWSDNDTITNTPNETGDIERSSGFTVSIISKKTTEQDNDNES